MVSHQLHNKKKTCKISAVNA